MTTLYLYLFTVTGGLLCQVNNTKSLRPVQVLSWPCMKVSGENGWTVWRIGGCIYEQTGGRIGRQNGGFAGLWADWWTYWWIGCSSDWWVDLLFVGDDGQIGRLAIHRIGRWICGFVVRLNGGRFGGQIDGLAVRRIGWWLTIIYVQAYTHILHLPNNSNEVNVMN